MDEATLFKALLDLNGELAALREEIRVGFASLPSKYVSQKAVDESRKEAKIAKRFALASVIASVGVLGTFLGIFL